MKRIGQIIKITLKETRLIIAIFSIIMAIIVSISYYNKYLPTDEQFVQLEKVVQQISDSNKISFDEDVTVKIQKNYRIITVSINEEYAISKLENGVYKFDRIDTKKQFVRIEKIINQIIDGNKISFDENITVKIQENYRIISLEIDSVSYGIVTAKLENGVYKFDRNHSDLLFIATIIIFFLHFILISLFLLFINRCIKRIINFYKKNLNN